ncbi:MAG TPA: hypothetical protein VN721_06080 [Flavipsychrobacter sp.]|nr:hypothetical protein [Flavipsychrobacter sp.]
MKKVLPLSKLLILAAFLTMPAAAFATVKHDPPPGAPLDGGLSILLIAGASYGAKKVADKRKKNTGSEK